MSKIFCARDRSPLIKAGVEDSIVRTCTYEDIYNLINQTIKDKLYDRDDSDSNMPVVYVQDVRVYNSEIEIWMTIRLLQTTWDGTTADVSVIRES